MPIHEAIVLLSIPVSMAKLLILSIWPERPAQSLTKRSKVYRFEMF